jgi:hypothetical protein
MPKLWAALALLITACQGLHVPPSAHPPTVRAFGTRYVIDGPGSQVLLLVYRGGPMASLGHNHVIAVHTLEGSVQLAEPLTESSFNLEFPVAAMTIDDPALRAAAGADFAAAVDDSARQGTRRNMLGDNLLQGERFPVITLRSRAVHGTEAASSSASTELRVRDQVSVVEVPWRIERQGNDLRVSGEFQLRQSRLGLTPYSILLGALRVNDQFTVRFRILAHRNEATFP